MATNKVKRARNKEIAKGGGKGVRGILNIGKANRKLVIYLLLFSFFNFSAKDTKRKIVFSVEYRRIDIVEMICIT